MGKIKVSNARTDSLFQAAGKAKIIKNYGFGKSKIQTEDKKTIKITPLSSTIKEDGSGIMEVARIRIDSIEKRKSREIIQRALSGGTNSDYTMSIQNLIDLNNDDAKNITIANPSYSIDVNFNYISQDYDNLQLSIDEFNLNSFLDKTSRQDFLNFKKRKNSKITNFSRGTSMKNFVMPQVPSETLTEFPYYIRTRLNDGVTGHLSIFLQKIQMFDEVLNDYLKSEKDSLEMNVQRGTYSSEEKINVYDLAKFFSSDLKIDLDNFYGVSNQLKASKMSLDLRKHLLKGFLKKETEMGFRRFSDILNGQECRKQALAYSIDKYDSVLLESAKIQTLYVPANMDSATFIDTQVKYGKTYFMDCKGHYMIIGNSYRYSNIRYYEEDGITYAIADVINTPSIIVKSLGLFTAKKNVIQPPPVFPQVHFKTENNSEKQIQIYFSPTKTEVKRDFVQITEADARQKEKMDDFFKVSNGEYKFETISESGLFETFRLSNPPKSYSDFANAKLAETRMPFSTGDAVFRDNLRPNEDYYYTFRQVNQKGLVSNPTSIFKIRLVVDADDAKVLVEEYHLPKQILSQPRQDLKSMVQIRPSIEQTLFNETQDALFNKTSMKGTLKDLKLGVAQHSVWGRKIKLRFRSKTSGKILDVNIDFNLLKNKSKEEF
jgi:hypothetical protein